MKDKKYIALYKSIKDKIGHGEYRSGTKLPSKRIMASITGYSLITVENAYKMLIDEGYIEPRERSGYFVGNAAFYNGTEKESTHDKLNFLLEDSTAFDGDFFEQSVWKRTVRKVLSERGREIFAKSPPDGCAVLRNAIAEYLLRYRGMFAQPSQIVIGSGAESLYEAAIRTLGRNKKYGTEDPCYSQITTVYEGLGITPLPLRMGNDGIEKQALETADIDVLHVTPFHSYPSGVTASAPKRYEYLSWAKKRGGYIIEDDFDSEFYIPVNPIDTLYSLDDSDRVIYINTFSKSLSPSFRMGYMILPSQLKRIYDDVMGRYSCTVPVLEQYVLSEFISSGNFERHLNRVRRRSAKQ